jgi:hypothetical protein
VTDLRVRLRDAITAAVEEAEPPVDLIASLRRRHRRRLRRLTAVSTAAIIGISAAVAVLVTQPAGPAGRQPAAGPTERAIPDLTRPLFPGGGRLLLAGGGELRWLYPDGKTILIRGRFDGATVSSGELLAWRYTNFGATYSTMRLDGSGRRQVLAAGHDRKLSVIWALLSPDGSRLAYVRQDLVSQSVVTDTLWVLDLATNQHADLGPISDSGVAWRDNSTILTAAPDGRSLVLVDAATGRKSTFLTVTDPALVRAYEQARPGAGPPAYIGSDGVRGSGPSAQAAVQLAAARHGQQVSPAEVIVTGTTPQVTYAPRTPEALSLTWGPDGLVLLRTGAGDLPGWNTYAAAVGSARLATPIPFGMDGAVFNPAGNVIALQDGQNEVFAPTPRPTCERTIRCLAFPPTGFSQEGTIQAWVR